MEEVVFMNKWIILILGILLSLLIITYLGYEQEQKAEFLKLPVHWLIVSLLPLLISLFVGGHISKVVGFGVEIEAALKTPVSVIQMKVSGALKKFTSVNKENLFALHDIPITKRRAIKSLKFSTANSDYGPGMILNYIERLPSLLFFEVINEKKEILSIIPIEQFQGRNGKFDERKIRKFAEKINQENAAKNFNMLPEVLSVDEDENMLRVFRRINARQVNFAIMIDHKGSFSGIVLKSDIAQSIAEVISNQH